MAADNAIWVIAHCKCNVWPITPIMPTNPCVDCKSRHTIYYDNEQNPFTDEIQAFDRFLVENNKRAKRDKRT